VKWFVNSKELIKSTKYFRIGTPEPFSTHLVINEIFPEDEGKYTCSSAILTGPSPPQLN